MRLNEFKALLKWGIAPSLHQMLNQDPYEHGPSQYYAAYWALTFALLHHPDEGIQRKRRQLLFEQLGVANRAPSLMDQILINGLLEEAPNIEDWELRWRRQIWALH